MRWSELIRGAGVIDVWQGPDPIITSVVEDSRQVTPGACFVAVRGSNRDGHEFVGQAVGSGAAAVLSERAVPLPNSVAGLSLQNARAMSGRLAAALYGLDRAQRSGALQVVGITGTNGKSTFCFLLRAILRHAAKPTALLGTIEYDLLARKIDASLTTPAAPELMSHLVEAVRAGATHAVLEVSSIALDQGRCEGIRFGVGVFSNLSRDHLDYHGDMENYLLAKKRLFDGLAPEATAVINADDPAAERMVADCRARVLRYAVETAETSSRRAWNNGNGRRPAGDGWLRARVQTATPGGTEFSLDVSGDRLPAGCCELSTQLVGRHNVQNCLAAAAAAVALGVPLDVVATGLASVTSVPGRLQRVLPPSDPAMDRGAGGAEGITACATNLDQVVVLVDYAHTEDALDNVLSALRPLTLGQLVVLFGCGGDRDPGKRPRMARTVGRWADRIVVTSDNPRTEDPERIIDDIMGGFVGEQRDRIHVEPDRRAAIAAAITMARPGDVVLLAGKGHEHYQLVGSERISFDDVVVAREALAAKVGP